MSLDKAIKHGKEKRKQYYRSKRFDKTCRPNGSCPWCRKNRLHKFKRQMPAPDETAQVLHGPYEGFLADMEPKKSWW